MYTLHDNTVFPPEDHGLDGVLETLKQASESFQESGSFTIVMAIEGKDIPLPTQVIEAMHKVVVAMLDRQAVVVLPIHETLTTQEAANLLGIRRRDLVDLLDADAIPYRQEGRHRRVELADVLAFEEKRSQESRGALKRMTQIGYEGDMHILCSSPELTA